MRFTLLNCTLFTCMLFATIMLYAQHRIELLDSNTFTLGEGVVLHKTSFRGLSVVDDNTTWVSGSRGTIARSTDGGKTFAFTQLKGYEKSDFRDIEAFDAQHAVIMSSGSPAYVLYTTDGGTSWKEAYKNTDTAYFLDAMDFWDAQRGMIVGDPVNGHFVMLQTEDGGHTWKELDTAVTPRAKTGEAIFAASGTSLRCWDKERFAFVTGGADCRVIYSKRASAQPGEQHYHCCGSQNLVIQKGKSSQGAFSLGIMPFSTVAAKKKHVQTYAFAVGGDYLSDTAALRNSFLFTLEGVWCGAGYTDTKGYKSCIEIMDAQHQQAIATGTSGTDWYERMAWKNFSSEPFHVVRKAKQGKAVFLAGGKGRIGKLVE